MAVNVLAERYRLEACLAIGGMGQVWRGWDLALGRPVAIKFMNDRCASDPQAPAGSKPRRGTQGNCVTRESRRSTTTAKMTARFLSWSW